MMAPRLDTHLPVSSVSTLTTPVDADQDERRCRPAARSRGRGRTSRTAPAENIRYTDGTQSADVDPVPPGDAGAPAAAERAHDPGVDAAGVGVRRAELGRDQAVRHEEQHDDERPSRRSPTARSGRSACTWLSSRIAQTLNRIMSNMRSAPGCRSRRVRLRVQVVGHQSTSFESSVVRSTDVGRGRPRCGPRGRRAAPRAGRSSDARVDVPGEQALLGVQPVLALVVDDRLRGVHHLVGRLDPAGRGQAVHELRVVGRARHQLGRHLVARLEGLARRSGISSSWPNHHHRSV